MSATAVTSTSRHLANAAGSVGPSSESCNQDEEDQIEQQPDSEAKEPSSEWGAHEELSFNPKQKKTDRSRG
jgi:hypothetical protein